MGQFWDYFGTSLDYFETILGPFWDHFGSILVPKCDQKSIKDRFGDHLGSKMGPKIDFEVHWGTLGDLGGRLGGPWGLLGGPLLKKEAIKWVISGWPGVPGEGRVGVNPYP